MRTSTNSLLTNEKRLCKHRSSAILCTGFLTSSIGSFQWDNHAKSLRLEQETLRKSQERIQEKVENKMGTWIDWQFLLAAASLLAKVVIFGLT